MKRTLLHIMVFSFALLMTGLSAVAQPPRINVSGYVINSANDEKIENVQVYGYSTVAAAKDAYMSLVEFFKNGTPPEFGITTQINTDSNGYFEMMLPPDGALVFFHTMAKNPVMKNVNGKEHLDVKMLIAQLDAATVTGTMEGLSAETEAELEGNNWNLKHIVTIPEAYGKTNARLIFQPFILAANEKDTLEFRRPLVYDGKEYRVTQERMLGFNPDADPLFPYFVDTLSSKELKIAWNDTIFIEDPTLVRHAKSITRIEDYTHIYFEKEDHINSTDKIRRPLKFLDFNIGTRNLDHEAYYVPPRKEKMPGKANLSISFLVGKAEIDPKDTLGRSQLNGLKETLARIISAEGSSLTEFGIVAKASPDGTYAKNVSLARERMEYAFNEVISAVPRNYRKYVATWKDSQVATWIEVAEAMEADSLKREGKAIRDIVAQYPDSPDAQFGKIRQLSFYRPTIVSYFPKLRSMTCIYESTVYRALTPEEIVANYFNEEKGYRTGKTPLSINEFWNLFKEVKDQDELEHLYRLAYDQTMKATGKPWILAANNLAVSCLNKGQVDTTILEPFIDLRYNRVDYVLKTPDPFGRITEEVMNPSEIVCNQLAMYLNDSNFKSASILAQLLPDTEEYKMMKAFTRVLGGYYKGGKTPEDKAERKRNFETVKESSPLNRVIMNLALSYDQFAEEALDQMDVKDPLRAYLRVVIETRRNPKIFPDMMLEQEMIELLKSAFYADPGLVEIAASDPDINETVFKYAKDDYEHGF